MNFMWERFHINLCDRVSVDVSGSGGGPHADSLPRVPRDCGFRDLQFFKNPGVGPEPLNLFEDVYASKWESLLHLR